MEKTPSFENKESTEQRLISLLKEKGAEDPEARALLDTWTHEQEEQVEKENDPIAAIELKPQTSKTVF